jgi:hypothetical protein
LHDLAKVELSQGYTPAAITNALKELATESGLIDLEVAEG